MEPFIGQIIMFGGNFAPRGWALCDGQLLPISQFTALFSILGTTYGGDGRTTFGLPELRGRVAMHPGSGPGLTTRRLGERSGQENVILTTNQIPSHNHGVSISVNTGAGEEADPTTIISSIAGAFNEDPTTGANLGGVNQNNVGGNQGHNNIQPFLCVNFIIALQGIFPSRN